MARFLGAENYPVSGNRLTNQEKGRRLVWMAQRNLRIRKKGLHLFLGFAQGESIQEHRLLDISRGFMEGMGLGAQPYLVYAHDDMERRHLHLVSTPVEPQGRRIPLYAAIREGRIQQTINTLEQKYGFYSLDEGQGWRKAGPARRARYGQEESRSLIGQILDQTLHRFHFETPEEWNALLGVYRIKAFYGRPGTPMHERGGLVYGFVDDRDRQIGVPIPASQFPQQPTKALLEKRMAWNRENPHPPPRRLRGPLEDFIGWRPTDWLEFREGMISQGMQPSWVRPFVDTEASRLFYVDMVHRRVISPDHLPADWQYRRLMEGFGPWPEHQRYRLPSVGRQRYLIQARDQLTQGNKICPSPIISPSFPREEEAPYYRKGKGKSPS